MRRFHNITYPFVLLFSFMLQGCLEDNTTCEPKPTVEDHAVTFVFCYDYNPDSSDRFAREIGEVVLFVYNAQTGELHERVETLQGRMQGGNSISLELPQGNYAAVALGNCDAGHYDITGHERIGSLRVSLKHVKDGVVISNDYSQLFHAVNSFSVVDTDVSVPMSTVKNTNKLTITVRGLDHNELTANGHFELTVRAAHLGYDYLNNPALPGVVTHYPDISNAGSDILGTTQLLRLLENDDTLKFTLFIKDPVTGKETQFEKNIISAILSGPAAGDWDSPQEYLDRHDSFNLVYVVDVDASGNVTLELWDVIDQPEELG